MGSARAVVIGPGPAFESRMFDGGEAVAPSKPNLEGLDEALAEAALLGGGGDVFLLSSESVSGQPPSAEELQLCGLSKMREIRLGGHSKDGPGQLQTTL